LPPASPQSFPASLRRLFEAHPPAAAIALHPLADQFEACPVERFYDFGEAIDNAPDCARACLHAPDCRQRNTRPVCERLLINAKKRARRPQLGSS
jgi:hypothetical protein